MQKITIRKETYDVNFIIMEEEKTVFCKYLQNIIKNFYFYNSNIIWYDTNEDGKIIEKLEKKFIILDFDNFEINKIINPYHDDIINLKKQKKLK
jgi:hypothetical protein